MPDNGWNAWAEEITQVVERMGEDVRLVQDGLRDIRALLEGKVAPQWVPMVWVGLSGLIGGIIGAVVVLVISG